MADDAQILTAVSGKKVIGIAAEDLSCAFSKPTLGSWNKACQRESGIVNAIFSTDEVVGGKGTVNILKSVIVNGVDLAEFSAHFADFEKKSCGKRSESDVGLFNVHSGFTKRDECVGAGVGVNDGLHADFRFVHFKRFTWKDIIVACGSDEIAD